MPSSPVPSHPHQALAVYAESLVVRRRVVVLGDDDTGVAERLTDLGARMVVTVRPGEDDDDLRPASFDLALVPDLGVFEEPARVVARARRLVGEGGAALISAVNRDAAGGSRSRAFDYYDLFDLVAREFGDVKMVAQVPFRGLTLAELGAAGSESPSVTLDAQLVDDPVPPSAFVALGSQRGARLDPYVIVEVPADEPATRPVDALAQAAREAEMLAASAALEGMRREVEAERRRAASAAEDLDGERLRAEALVAELDLARRTLLATSTELDLERQRGEALGADLESLRGVVLTMEGLEREVSARGRALVELSSEVDRARADVVASVVVIEQLRGVAERAERAERGLAEVEPEMLRLAEAQAVEIARLEEALRDRAQALRALEAEVARRDRMVRELVVAVGEGATSPGTSSAATHDVDLDDAAELLAEENARLRERLDGIALDLARREGEVQAAAWAAAELERRLAEASSAAAARATDSRDDAKRRDAEGSLRTALDEIDALRRALSQEHDERLRAEAALARTTAALEPPVASSPPQS